MRRATAKKIALLSNLRAGSLDIEINPRLSRQENEPLLYKRNASAFLATPVIEKCFRCKSMRLSSRAARPADAFALPRWMLCDCPDCDATTADDQRLFGGSTNYADVVSTCGTLAYLAFPSISNKVAASPIGLAAEELVSKMLPCLKASDFLARLTLAATALLLRFHQPRKLESAWGLAD